MAETCAGCKYSTTRLTFLGFRFYCIRFRCLRSFKCIDFRGKK